MSMTMSFGEHANPTREQEQLVGYVLRTALDKVHAERWQWPEGFVLFLKLDGSQLELMLVHRDEAMKVLARESDREKLNVSCLPMERQFVVLILADDGLMVAMGRLGLMSPGGEA